MNGIKVFSVSEYVTFLNEALFERDAVVEGEVSEYKVNQDKWVFFKIKDEHSTLECFSIKFKIHVPLEDGMRVRVYGHPRIYPKTGRFSINVEWAEPTGEGALKRAFELLKAELEKEGLFAPERKRALPRFPKTIGLIASKESAAYGDFIKVLKERFGGIHIFFYHVRVQGSEAIADIEKAFSYFNLRHTELGVEAIVLVRGGGSLEDLAAFNSREVAYAVFGSLTPVIVGVGHEEDVTIADFVADVRASTPSNAGELLVPYRGDVWARVSSMAAAMESELLSRVNSAARDMDAHVSRLDRVMLSRSHALAVLRQKLSYQLNYFAERIILGQSKVDHFTRLLSSFSPLAVLERGYAIVKKGGRVMASARGLHTKDTIDIRFRDGEVGAEIL